jgi:hypothetical protein
MTRPVVGIFSRINPMEDTDATRGVVSRSCHVADYCDGSGAGSDRVIAGTEAPRRLLSRVCPPQPSGPSPRSAHTMGRALGTLARATARAGAPLLWRRADLPAADLCGTVPGDRGPIGAPDRTPASRPAGAGPCQPCRAGGTAGARAGLCDKFRHAPPPPADGAHHPSRAAPLGGGGVCPPAGLHVWHLAGGSRTSVARPRAGGTHG